MAALAASAFLMSVLSLVMKSVGFDKEFKSGLIRTHTSSALLASASPECLPAPGEAALSPWVSRRLRCSPSVEPALLPRSFTNHVGSFHSRVHQCLFNCRAIGCFSSGVCRSHPVSAGAGSASH